MQSSGSRSREADRRPTTTSASAPSRCLPLSTLSYSNMARPFSLMSTRSCFRLEKPPRREICSSWRPSLIIAIYSRDAWQATLAEREAFVGSKKAGFGFLLIHVSRSTRCALL